MVIEFLNNEEYWEANIYWNAPHRWYKDEGVYLDKDIKNECGIYRFERRHGNQTQGRENLYIGITYRQDFDNRLHQGYHNYKIRNIRHGQIWVSLGIIDLKGSVYRNKRYEEIEAILIYFTQPKLNDCKKKWGPSSYFEITNKGYKGPLPRYIKYPAAQIYY